MGGPWVRWVRDLAEEATQADDLLEARVREALPDEARQAIASMGSWERLLAAALVEAHPRRASGEDEEAQGRLEDVPAPERKPDRVSREAALAIVDDEGCLWRLQMAEVPVHAQPRWEAFPIGGLEARHIVALRPMRDLEPGRVVFTTQGQAVTQDLRLMAPWEPGASARPLPDRYPQLDEEDRALTALSRRELRPESLLVHVTAGGQLKVTEAREFGKLGTTPLLSFLVREGDVALDAFWARTQSPVFLGTNTGRGLAFELSQVRPQGRKATGVRAIALEGDARVVAAFVWDPKAWMVLSTAQGMIKRMPSSLFRLQGRAGAGLQTSRLGSGDEVVSIVQGDIADDVMFVSTQGRCLRMPLWQVPLADRNHRGSLIDGLHEEEGLLTAAVLPPGEFATDENG